MNTNIFKGIGLFVSGVAFGAFAANYFLKDKYKKIADEEIESVKAAFSRIEDDVQNDADYVDEQTKAELARKKPDIKEYAERVRSNNYDYSAISKKPTVNVEVAVAMESDSDKDCPDPENPRVIPPEELGELHDYDTTSLTLYADGVLVDENGERVPNVNELIGLDSLNHFGEYENDSVCVRNDNIKCDFEILKDLRKYSEVVAKKPLKPHEMEE